MDTRIVFATSHDGVRVAAAVEGSGFPLLWPGLPVNSRAVSGPFFEHGHLWFERLTKRHQLIALDLRGTGLADRHCQTHTFADYVTDMSAMLDELHVGTVDILAMGVRFPIAIRFAALHPVRVRRLLLAGVTVGPTAASGSAQALAGSVAREFVARDFRGYLETLAARTTSSEVSASAYADRLEQCTDQVSMLAELEALEREDIRDDLRRLRCPCLVVELRDNTMIAPGHSAAFQALVPQAEIVLVPNRTKVSWLHDFADAIEHFEDRLDAAENTPGNELRLSPREVDVLRLVVSGFTNASIAEALTISRSTVDRHVANIYAKAGVHNRAEVVRWAIAHGIVDPGTT
ncbi:MAG: alpha/beta fold hydrolase [Dehalococcoidia bacterium]